MRNEHQIHAFQEIEGQHVSAYQQGFNDRQRGRELRSPKSDGSEWCYRMGYRDGAPRASGVVDYRL